MKDHATGRHPGPFRFMRVDSEVAGLFVAVGFLVMGFVSMPIATWFVIGAIVLGVAVALLLRFTSMRFRRVAARTVIIIAGTVIILAAGVSWWKVQTPRRPHSVSPNALYVPNNVRFTLHKTGYWVDCWFDEHANVDRCKLTDKNGTVTFEDVFLRCCCKRPLQQSELAFDARQSEQTWTRSPDDRLNIPVVYLKYGEVLVPQSFYAEAKRDGSCSPL